MFSHITYEQLLKLTSYGVFAMGFKGTSIQDKRLEECKKIDGAMHRGIYTGSPGKDIYLMLPFLTDEQMEEIIKEILNNFPNIPPGNHVNVAACIRFIYGQFEKQGILRSKKDFERMKKEKLDWELPRKFLKLLYKEFENNNNFYGLSMLCEMEGHRLGDEAVIYKDKNKLKEMEETYNKSVAFAYKCKSYKHLFTPYYWSGSYFAKLGETKKAIKYYKLTFEQAEKYCPDSRDGYIYKLAICAKYIRDKDGKRWNSFCKTYKKNSKNKCVKKLFEKLDVFIGNLKGK